MTDAAHIRAITERNVKVLNRRPEKGHLTGITKASVTQGLRCVIEEGTWQLAADMPSEAGGNNTAPTPGMLGRGALASCLAIGIRIWAARMDVPIDSLEVEVQADFDARGELGIGEMPAGYQEVRYLISIDSPAAVETLAELLATAERHSPYLDVFCRAQPTKRVLRVNGAQV